MTKIEWSDVTWNPWIGCKKIAPECDNCYAATFASRRIHDAHDGTAEKGDWTGVINQNTPAVWDAPYSQRGKWLGRRLVFTCSMSDFWHERVPNAWLERALSIIESTPHTYQILSKRPGNIARRLRAVGRSRLPDNVWLGATCGHPHSLAVLKPLLRIEATARFLSVEPMLAPMAEHLDLDGIGWVIGGGESGPRGRHCGADWMRALRDLCVARRVPFFLKQWGRWENNPTPRHEELATGAKGGATLDGRLWREFPARRHLASAA